MTNRYTSLNRYSHWDGTQLRTLDAGDILNALSDDLMEFGDLQQAMRYLMQRGMETSDGGYIKGLRDLIRQLKEQRRQHLDRFDMDSVLEDIKKQLDEILRMEKESVDQWIDKQSDSDLSSESIHETDENSFSNRVLGDIGRKSKRFIDNLPPDTAGRVKSLQEYEFLNTDAQKKFLKLIDDLQKAMTRSFFGDIEKMVNNMSDGDVERMKNMIKDLNDLLVKKISGHDADSLKQEFNKFMRQYGDMFGDNPPATLEALLEQMQQQMAATQSLLNSMSPQQQEQLRELMAGKFGDPELNSELARLAKEMEFLNPNSKGYDFSGNEEVGLKAAMELMDEMARLDQLEQDMQRAQYDGKVDDIDKDRVEDLLGSEARENLEEIEQMLKVLEDAGYARKDGDKWELTPRGSRSLGQKALGEIYKRLKNQNLGNHAVPEEGRFGERMEESKPYEFGDPFHLHMPRTIRNAIDREGPGAPISLKTEDFEIYRSEMMTQTATVLMVDLSWSMALRGSFQSAKKVAMALHNLITTTYPRDSLYILGFSAFAKEIKAHDLPYLQYDDYLLGTNMQHALMLAEKMLAKHPQGTRQIIMITDGEPTAHLDNGRPVFAYPPTAETINKTLKAVKSCTARNIMINTFMLDQSYYLKAFIDRLTKINGGRVFYTEPDNLGEYVLVDYFQHKKKLLQRR